MKYYIYVKCVIISYFYLCEGKRIFFSVVLICHLYSKQTSTFPKMKMNAAIAVPIAPLSPAQRKAKPVKILSFLLRYCLFLGVFAL